MTVHLRYSVLGPVRAWRDNDEIDLGSPQQQAILAVLLLREGTLTTIEELVDAIWSEEPPRTAAGTVRTYVSRLRRVLDPEARRASPAIESFSGGYAMRVPSDAVDLGVFRKHLARAQMAQPRADHAAVAAALRDALALWQGIPLAGVPGAYAAAQRDRLMQVRLGAQIDRIAAELDLGRHAEATAELSVLVAEHPLRERLRELFMLALYGCGRQAEALATYRDIRRRLTGELGINPGADLQRTHQRILAADPALSRQAETEQPATPVASAPNQLPPDLSDFTGRSGVFADITDMLAQGDGVPVVAVTGMGGVGKTALAVHAGHTIRTGFPDGQVFADLAATSERPTEPYAVLAGFLRAFEVAEEDLPEALSDRVALWRTILASRRVLVVLDDARDSAQVRDLLPATPGSAAIITSRRQILDLSGSGWVKLDPFRPDEALLLMERIAGSGRIRAEIEAARRLVADCSCLPHAVRLVGARLVARPRWSIAETAERVLEELQVQHRPVEHCPATGVPFERGVRQLTGEQARAFRLLALPETQEISIATAAAMLQLPEAHAETVLESLADVHLIEPGRRGRYRYVDLVRRFARHLAFNVDGPAACQGALARTSHSGDDAEISGALRR